MIERQIYDAVRYVAADLCDVAAQRTALVLTVGDAWSTTAHRLRDTGTPFVLGTHHGLWSTYSGLIGSHLYADVLGAGALIEYLDLFELSTRLAEAEIPPQVVTQCSAMLNYLIAPAAATWVTAARATTCGTWIAERDGALAAEAAKTDVGEIMAIAAPRIEIPCGVYRGPAPLIGSVALALRRMLDHPEDGKLLVDAKADLGAVLARLGDPT